MSTVRPVLLNSCARAATAAEARFRIDVPLAPARATRVISLDPGSDATVHRAAAEQWHQAAFYTLPEGGGGGEPGPEGLQLVASTGESRRLGDELSGVDAVVMVASSDVGAGAASTIGAACTVRGITTAGLVLVGVGKAGVGEVGVGGVAEALSALRPHARVLMVPADDSDLVELLRAIRA